MVRQFLPKVVVVGLCLSLLAGTAIAQDATAPAEAQPVEVQPDIVSLLPKEIKDRHYLTIHLTATAGLPFGVSQDGEFLGLSADLARALATVMGLEPRIVGADFAATIPGLQAKRYDLSTAVVTDTPERRKIINIVDYVYTTESQLLVKKGRAPLALADTCGMAIGVTAGSFPAKMAEQASEKCVTGGRAPIDVKSYSSNAEGILAVKSGRDVGFMASTGNLVYAVANDPTLEPGGDSPGPNALNGVALPLDSPLLPATRAAMVYLYNSGKLQQILDHWSLGSLIVKTVEPIENTTDNVSQFLK